MRDEINFGLGEGGELPVETTICDEIRQSRLGVVIDNVAADAKYCNHHTPQMYKLQSYISVPIILNSGEFFGTLCAIDPNPHKVSDLKVTGMFTLFAELIAFHLQAIQALESSQQIQQMQNAALSHAKQESKRYEHITYHSLREPVRKISLFSDRLLGMTAEGDISEMKNNAAVINRCSNDLASMLHQLEAKA